MHVSPPFKNAALLTLAEAPPDIFYLQSMGCVFSVHCQAEILTRHAIFTAFAGLLQSRPEGANIPHEHEYYVRESAQGLELTTHESTVSAHGLGDLLYLIDKQITLALQGARKDLLFLHGGALTTQDGRVIVVTASSGSRKSTLTWAMLNHGFGYLSDELAPVDLKSLNVQAYPHALCLKKRPPAPYALPPETLETSRSLHVPVTPCETTGPLAAVFFVDHRHPPGHPILAPIGAARAALRLYPNTLNPLAHANDGLDAVADITRRVPCYELNSANLPATCEAVSTLLR